MPFTSFLPFDKYFIEHKIQHKKFDMKSQHYHDCYEVYLQISGERYLFYDDIFYTLKRGDLVIFKPFDIHYTESRDVDFYERYVLNFKIEDLSFFLTQVETVLLVEKLQSCVVHLDEQQTQLIHKYFKQADDFSKQSGLFLDKLFFSTVFQMIVTITNLPQASKLSKSHTMQPEIVTVLHYISDHYNESIDLDTVAELVHMSKYHFCRLFHRTTGATFLEYLYNIRLTKVHKLLLQTQLTLQDIANKTGFSSTAHLTRIFRQIYNVSPREFRKKMK